LLLVELQDCSVADVKDSFLRQSDKNTNEGANTLLAIGRLGQHRIVVGFDLSGVNVGAITSAHLLVHIKRNMRGWPANGSGLAAFALVQDFIEGNGHSYRDHSPSRGIGSGVTYRCAIDSAIGNNAVDCQPTWDGGAFSPLPTDTVPVTNATTGTIASDVTADARLGQTEWLVKPEDPKHAGNMLFDSRQGAATLVDPTIAPRLELDYGSTSCFLAGRC
jgi:hypothetical protein